MKTYSAIWESGGFLFQKCPASDLIGKLPTGSTQISGDKKDKITGEVIERRAVYRDPNTLRKFSVIEDKDETVQTKA